MEATQVCGEHQWRRRPLYCLEQGCQPGVGGEEQGRDVVVTMFSPWAPRVDPVVHHGGEEEGIHATGDSGSVEHLRSSVYASVMVTLSLTHPHTHTHTQSHVHTHISMHTQKHIFGTHTDLQILNITFLTSDIINRMPVHDTDLAPPSPVSPGPACSEYLNSWAT